MQDKEKERTEFKEIIRLQYKDRRKEIWVVSKGEENAKKKGFLRNAETRL